MDNMFFDIDMENLPKHIAIIMDGNGRWAKKRFLPRTAGHKAGVETVRTVITECKRLGIKHVTLYTFSTENWKRPALEVETLMTLLQSYLKKEVAELNRNNVKLTAIGDIEKLPKSCLEELKKAMELTKNNDGPNLNLALNYGGRYDITNAVKQISRDIENHKLNSESITEETIKNYLSTKSIPDPDLVIRTSGEQRLSNFLLWELAYAELYFTDVFWPDFDEKELQKAIYAYQNRDRRFGGLK
ncbi:isoprenyl transferase [Intestinibacter sp.]|uniref:isoprenyl transferase n=1 Tax=Intestinibacter sp. TaxID=1965304 RepID=UPI002A91D0B5|nr:isoprenyl transferase [Intestinibacter sp.]MDY5212427.1 isoprenyl transferase [Intestinibacter sp.]